MKKQVFTYGFCESFMDNLTDFIDKNYLKEEKDLRRLAICFGGRRPALFLKRELAKRVGHGFCSPRFFTADEFMTHIIGKKERFTSVKDLDGCYVMYCLAQEHAPVILEKRKTFAQFFHLAKEILRFIDQLDIEGVENERLKNVEANAQIGYPVPRTINQSLEHIIVLRTAYHDYMKKNKTYSRGFQYRRAAELVAESDFEEFDDILFCHFFYFNYTQTQVVKNLYDRHKAILFFQGDERRWPILKNISEDFSCTIKEGPMPQTPSFNLNLYSAFDVHSQIGMVREILKKVKPLKRSVVVLPEPEHMIPLVSQMSSFVKDFNISMGYPLTRSSLSALLGMIFKTQLSKNQDGYYTRAYLAVLRHPLVKGLDLRGDGVTRVLIHKIEELLKGDFDNPLAGRLFIKPEEIFSCIELYRQTMHTLQEIKLDVTRQDLEEILSEVHRLVFSLWEGVDRFDMLGGILSEFLDIFISKSSLSKYPLNLKITSRLWDIIDEFQTASFRHERFPREALFKIFEAKMQREIVAFSGSPLKGLQILGLFETRSLDFENVIVLDTNEGVLPRLTVYDPLIPREVMMGLGLNRLEVEEEIQRYQFMRLISSAKNVFLVYQENKDKERSRFVEELVWEQEKKAGQVSCGAVLKPHFETALFYRSSEIRKTPEMIKFLKNYTYSASSINTYLRSPLEFYDNYVLGLKEKDDLLEEPENRQVGTFVHGLLEETFKKFLGKKPVINKAFRTYFQKMLDERFAAVFERSMNPDVFLLKSVLDERLTRFLEHEDASAERRVAKILFIEKRFEDVLSLSCGEIKFVYQVDRVDRMQDKTIMIVDYKTGSVDPMPKGIDRIENMNLSRETVYENVKSFQIPLYFFYLDRFFKDESINACFYNLRTLKIDKFVDKKMTFNRERIKAAFLRALDFILSEILDPSVPFRD